MEQSVEERGLAPISEPAAEAEAGPAFDTGQAVRYSIANFGAQMVYGLLNIGMPLYLDRYGLDPRLIALLANERSFVGAFVQPVVGRISDHIRTPLGRRRPFFLVGIPLMALSLLLLALRPDLWIVIALMTIGSFFLAIAFDPYIALMGDLFPPEHRGRVGGLLGLVNALAIITFSLMAYVLWNTQEWLVFALTIGTLVLTFAITFFTIREPPAPPREAAPAGPRARPDPVAYVRGLLRYPEVTKYMLAVAFFWLGSGGATPFVTLFGTHALRATEAEAFLLPLAFVVSTALFAVPAGWLADRIGKKRVLTIGLLIYGLAGLAGSQSADLLQGTLALGVIGIGNAGLAVNIALLTDLVPKARMAEFVGLVSGAIWSFVQPLGSVIAGTIVVQMEGVVGRADAYRWSFIFAGAMILVAALLLQLVHPERARTDE
jgi:MFS family permease